MKWQRYLPILLLGLLAMIDIITVTPDDAIPGVGWADELLLILITILSYVRTIRKGEG